jgi:hypothetical protein
LVGFLGKANRLGLAHKLLKNKPKVTPQNDFMGKVTTLWASANL